MARVVQTVISIGEGSVVSSPQFASRRFVTSQLLRCAVLHPKHSSGASPGRFLLRLQLEKNLVHFERLFWEMHRAIRLGTLRCSFLGGDGRQSSLEAWDIFPGKGTVQLLVRCPAGEVWRIREVAYTVFQIEGSSMQWLFPNPLFLGG